MEIRSVFSILGSRILFFFCLILTFALVAGRREFVFRRACREWAY